MPYIVLKLTLEGPSLSLEIQSLSSELPANLAASLCKISTSLYLLLLSVDWRRLDNLRPRCCKDKNAATSRQARYSHSRFLIMSLSSGFTTNALPTSPPIEDLEHDLRELLQNETSDRGAALYPSPIMEHESYHRHQYGNAFSDSHRSVGLGIQYVCRI